MSEFLDHVLKSPNKIDIYAYAIGAGGEFFSTLCAIAHYKTREILSQKTLEVRGFSGDGSTRETLVFNDQRYFRSQSCIGLNLIGKNIFHVGMQLEPPERVEYFKMCLFHELVGYLIKDEKYLPDGYEYYSDKNIIMATHWVNPPDYNKWVETGYGNERRLGMPLFESQDYWSVINLNPETPRAHQMIDKFVEKSRIVNHSNRISYQLKHPAFTKIKLKFPFMDYIVENNFDAIKYYIEDRYGPDIDHDFIDQALIDYKKIRVDPYL